MLAFFIARSFSSGFLVGGSSSSMQLRVLSANRMNSFLSAASICWNVVLEKPEGSGISSVDMAASLFRPVLGSIPGSNTELDRRSVNPSLQSGNGEPGSE